MRETPRQVAAWIPPTFVACALYDGVLGLAFLLAPHQIYAAIAVPPPNHLGYIHFPAALLLVFAAMAARVAAAPRERRELMLYLLALKAAYVAVALGHHLADPIPPLWLVFTALDALFAIAFAASFLRTRPTSGGAGR